MNLKNWTAARSGAHITINGIDADKNEAVRLTGVEKIEPAPDLMKDCRCLATGADGELHKLI